MIRTLQLSSWNAEAVAEGYELPLEAVHAAIAFYGLYSAEVDIRIEHNIASFRD